MIAVTSIGSVRKLKRNGICTIVTTQEIPVEIINFFRIFLSSYQIKILIVDSYLDNNRILRNYFNVCILSHYVNYCKYLIKKQTSLSAPTFYSSTISSFLSSFSSKSFILKLIFPVASSIEITFTFTACPTFRTSSTLFTLSFEIFEI